MKRVLLVNVFLLLIVGCGPVQDPSASDKGKSSSDQAVTDSTADADCSAAALAGPSEACCTKHGADACGANLFCAALDGREIPTCYIVRSQTAGLQCEDDIHCLSESCGDDGLCRALPGQSCADGESCHASVCADDICQPTTGEFGSLCEEDAHCTDEQICEVGQCVNAVGAGCGSPTSYGNTACATRFCEPEGLSSICAQCASDAECGDQNGEFEVCEQGRCVHTCRNDSHCELMNINCGGYGLSCSYSCLDGVCRQ